MSNQPESWPSNFAPTEPAQPLPAPQWERSIQALDAFGVSFYGWPLDNLWGVVMDGDGHLRPVSYKTKGQLPDALQIQFNTHTLQNPPRALEAEFLYLFALEYLENLADTPGFNDPVSLCGRMFGPFPTWHGRAGQPRVCRGRFCVSRADVLDGLIRGAPFIFNGTGSEARGETLNRSHHLMLPSGLTEAPSSQARLVLAYPLPIGMREAADNTTLTAALAYDVLSKLQNDLRRAGVCGAFPDLILPVPSRRSLEARLKSKGYEVRGDYAYAPTAKPAKSWIGKLFEGLVRERKELPPEAALPGFLRLSKFALECLSGWPSAQAQGLRRQCRVLEAAWPPEGLAGLSRVVNDDDVVEKKDELILRHNKQKGANALFRLLPEFFWHGCNFAIPLDFEVEWFDDKGGGQICYVPGWKEDYKIHATYSLSRSKTWTTAAYRIPDTRTDCKLWGGDLGIYFHHSGKQPLRIRHVKVRACRPGHLDAEKQRLYGGLDNMGNLECAKGEFQCDAEMGALHFSGYLADLAQGTAQGLLTLILESEQGYWPVAVQQRHNRPDVVQQCGGAYSMAGFTGLLPLKDLDGYSRPGGSPLKGPLPGTYRIILRITIGGNYADKELWQRLKLLAPKATAETGRKTRRSRKKSTDA